MHFYVLTPSLSSIISLPTVANVVHLQFAIAFTAHLLCTLHLQTSHDRPCDVTENEYEKTENFF